MKIEDYAERNRAAWNQAAPIHRKHRKTNLQEAVQAASFCVLDDLEKGILENIGVQGKAVAQVCCNNGRELISVMKMGAAEGVGFDIADEFVKEAQTLGELSKTNCRFVRTHIYDIDRAYFGRFDVVYITIGALCWFDDLGRFFEVVAGLLKEGGHLFVYEMHPCINLIALPGEDPYEADNELKIAYSYFKEDPFVDTDGLDYIGQTQYKSKPTYSFPHTTGDILTTLLDNGLVLRRFEEYPHDISASAKHLEKHRMLPLSYTLVAQK